MIICFFRMADCNYTQNYSHHVCNHVGVRRLGSGKLGVIWSQSPIYRSKCIARNPRLSSGIPLTERFTNLKSGAVTSSPTFSPQPLCLDVVQLEFHSHLVQVDWVDCLLPFRMPFLVTSPKQNNQPPQRKRQKSWIQSEKKQQTKRPTKWQGLLILHSSILPFEDTYEMFFYDFAERIIWKSQ